MTSARTESKDMVGDQIRSIFKLLASRLPTGEETKALIGLYEDQKAEYTLKTGYGVATNLLGDSKPDTKLPGYRSCSLHCNTQTVQELRCNNNGGNDGNMDPLSLSSHDAILLSSATLGLGALGLGRVNGRRRWKRTPKLSADYARFPQLCAKGKTRHLLVSERRPCPAGSFSITSLYCGRNSANNCPIRYEETSG